MKRLRYMKIIMFICLFLLTFIQTFTNEKKIRTLSPITEEMGEQSMKIDTAKTKRMYSPLDGQTVEVTPPAFIWKPVQSAISYTVQISNSKEFPEETTRTYKQLNLSVFVPKETLSPGQWFWRVGVRSKNGIIFGKIRSFKVTASARQFPFPDWDKVIAKIPRTRPRLFFPGKNLDQYRQWALNRLKPVMEDLSSSCLKEVNRELVPEPGKRPKKLEFGPWALEVMRTTRSPMDVMENCALAYLLMGDRQLGQEARRRLLHFFSWDPEGPTGFFSYDEPAMWMMMRGIRAYDWTYDLYSQEEHARIETAMKARAKQFLKRLHQLPFESNPYNSHAGRLPGFLGECALSFIHEWPEAREWLEYVTLLYYTSFPAWGGNDGGWHEGPHYWNAYMKFALHFIIALHEATGIDLMTKPFFRNTPYFALYTATPYHQNIPFGDGQTGNPSKLGPLMYAFSTLLDNPYFRWYSKSLDVCEGTDLLTLTTFNPFLEAISPINLPQARQFPSVGIVSFHTALGDKEKDISFLMRSSPYGSVSHGHADQNAFVVEAFGRGLAIATGYYPWYNSPHHDQWTRATRSVNSILVNGQGQRQRSWEACGQINAFISTENYDYAEAEAAPAYMGLLKRFRRHVLHVRPGIFVIFDDLKAPQPARYQWLLHAYHNFKIGENKRLIKVQNLPAKMEIHMLLPRQLEISQTNKYTPEPELEPDTWDNTWHLVAEPLGRSSVIQFLTVLSVYRQEEESNKPLVELLQKKDSIGVRLTIPNGDQNIVIFNTNVNGDNGKKNNRKNTTRIIAYGKDKEGNLTHRFAYPANK